MSLDFLAEDYRFTADLLRQYSAPDDPGVRAPHRNSTLFRAVCSNNLNIILAALAHAEAVAPRAPPEEEP